MIRIAAAGGGTGGHLYPLLAILETLSRMVETKILFFAVKGKIDERVVKKEHPEYETISLNIRGLLRPLYHPKNIWRTAKLMDAILKVRKKLKEFKPDVVILTGGYISGVVGLAAKSMKTSIYVHEQNVVPGLAVKTVAKYARKIFVSFEKTRSLLGEWKNKTLVTGCPVREPDNNEAVPLKDFILVLGGSLGSDKINQLMEEVYRKLPHMFFVHSTGSEEWSKKLSKFSNVAAYSYIENMSAFWKRAAMSISRAGASTIGEMLYYGVPGILIPWEDSAESHQLENALEAERLGYAVVIREKEVNAQKIVEAIDKVIKKGKIKKMKENPALIISKEILGEIR
ncbi:undecaprenyldiphospho-muramoylpentapeptide beta-N-acetylglucosaminyltransferase [Thermotoga sp. KOL6]|uniref:undecaprenyldiphospho-muramoylpentapeptide beta-N-acetylglucosaminyltransferase n=1 Tax=Thermotoga sp. KOL6 TaxID=126741 RepID=UPI000C7925C9|nr:undecaprenyldiphospho-muramoylpentapeptide beta-N-acetylglucosaminyltransferase [Thermotoga sp. KOL6]PLV58987.1 UDP-N-acetylglucosamine--N-acetylmuramyl-(pentapeptide) pyrophosphoryl-undecaprenol N-acetylglucosamine transferase [Thermotoga sp. KOL6]